MSKIDYLLWFTGLVAWAYVAFRVASLLADIFVGFVRAASWARWQLTMCREYNSLDRINWRRFLALFSTQWLEFAATDGITWHGPRGRWEGVGNWEVYPSSDKAG